MDSSLIFLAVIGIWLVYFVPRLVARRQRAMSSGLAERDSRAMRVLARSNGSETGRSASRGYLLDRYEETRSPQPSRPPAAGPVSGRRGPSIVRIILFLVFAASVVLAPGAAVLAHRGAMGWGVPVTFFAVGFLAFATLRARARSRSRVELARVRSDLAPAQAVVVGPAEEPVVDVAPVTGHDEIFDEDAHRQIDLAAAEAALAVRDREREAARANLKPGEWLPHEVPLPTYLLKPAAPQRRTGAPSAPVAPAAAHNDEQDETIDLTWYDQHAPLRRAVGD